MLRRGLCSTVVQLRPDLVEAYVRAGRREEAEAMLARLETDTGGAPLLRRAAAARCRGLLAPDEEVRAAFEAALALSDELPMPFEKARTQLALGERLRRAKQRAEAREPLTAALDAFERLGARPWAERARTELRATGGPAGTRRTQAAAEQLTPHELQIAVLVEPGHDEPRGGGRAVPVTEDDRVPPRPDLPQARRPRPRPARAADGDGAARGRARPGRAELSRRRPRPARTRGPRGSAGCRSSGSSRRS